MLSKIESLELAKQKKKQLQTYQHSTIELINTNNNAKAINLVD